MNFILFGPPGVGKSTLIAILKSHGVRAIDLEDVYPSKVRFALPNQLSDVVLGAADLDPARSYPNAKKILLIAEQDVYDSRRAVRDAASIADKGSQKKHSVGAWTRMLNWDLVLDTTHLTKEDTAKRLQSFVDKQGGGATHG